MDNDEYLPRSLRANILSFLGESNHPQTVGADENLDAGTDETMRRGCDERKYPWPLKATGKNSRGSLSNCCHHVPQMMRWRSSTAYLLSSNPGGRGNVGPYFDVLDNVMGVSFLECLRAELQQNGWIDKLTPALTSTEAQGGKGSCLLRSIYRAEDGTEHTLPRMRGDMSTFVSRSERRRPKFALENPYLNRLVAEVEREASRCCGWEETQVRSSGGLRQRMHMFRFDLAKTSVQIARYPGNGTGYVRHCDRGASCASPADLTSSHATGNDAQRILTAVYYLHERDVNDWCVERDGGCLRVYLPNGCNNELEEYNDVLPLSDRMVLFRSDLVEHEVLPCFRPRLAITVWIYGWSFSVPSSDCSSFNALAHLPADTGDICDAAGKSVARYEVDNICHLRSEETDSDLCNSDRKDSGPPPLRVCHERVIGTHVQTDTIYVSIPSYRDTETYPTIQDLVDKACNPDRISVGVVLQVDTSLSQLERESCDFQGLRNVLPQPWADRNMRIVTVDYRHATGPCWARSVAQGLWRGEKYVLQIDSHMRVRKNWDSYLIQQLCLCPDPTKAVLTTYPPGYKLPNNIPNDISPTILVPWKFDDTGMLRQLGRKLSFLPPVEDGYAELSREEYSYRRNIPSPLWAAGFNFSTSEALTSVPYDPFLLSYLFFGEEASMAARLYTSGYDFYAPPEAVCYHLWSRNHRPTFQNDVRDNFNDKKDKDGECRKQKDASIDFVLGQLRGKEVRGMGSVRTVEQFAEQVGVDFHRQQILPGAENAGLDASHFAHDILGTSSDAMQKKIIETIFQ